MTVMACLRREADFIPTDCVPTDVISTEIHVDRLVIMLYLHFHQGAMMSCVIDYDFAINIISYGFCLQLRLGFRLGLEFFKHLCDNVHHKLAYNISDMFDGGACNYKNCRLAML